MAWIHIEPEGNAIGLLAEIYGAARKRAGMVFNILKLQSANPNSLRSSMALYADIMHGDSPLTRAQREMLAVVVSTANGCHY